MAKIREEAAEYERKERERRKKEWEWEQAALEAAYARPDRCETCKHWEWVGPEYKVASDRRPAITDPAWVKQNMNRGLCHLLPPGWTTVNRYGRQWSDTANPVTWGQQWCGQWKAESEEEQPNAEPMG